MKTSLVIGAWSLLLAVAATAAAQSMYIPTHRDFYNSRNNSPTAVNYAPSIIDKKVDGHAGYNAGRAAEPPSSESEKLWMFLITSDQWQTNPREKEVVGYFQNQRLSRVWASTRHQWYTQSNPHYKDRLRAYMGDALPIVCVQRPDGEVLLNVTGLSMPHSANELADLVDDSINARYAPPTAKSLTTPTQIVTETGRADCPNCPDDRPQPNVNVEPVVQPIPEVLPPKAFDPLLLGGVGSLAGLVLAALTAAVVWLLPRGTSDNTNHIF
jgi:hypothetical protein